MKVKYPAEGMFCVWVGQFRSEQDFEEWIFKKVEPSLKIGEIIDRLSEGVFNETEASVESLLRQFSQPDAFSDEAIDVSNSRGISKVNGAFVCYHLGIREAPETWSGIHFLGCFGDV